MLTSSITQSFIRNVIVTGVLMALLITTIWLIVRGDENYLPTTSPESNQTPVNGVIENYKLPRNESYSGVLEVLSRELIYPNSSLDIENENITIKGSGYNLSLLGNDKLKVNNNYPFLDIEMTGKANKTDKGYDIFISKITPEFKVQDGNEMRPVDAPTREKILQELRSSKITFPTVSETLPYKFETLSVEKDGKLTIRGVSNSTGYFVFMEQ
jgi:hypothetical protein